MVTLLRHIGGQSKVGQRPTIIKRFIEQGVPASLRLRRHTDTMYAIGTTLDKIVRHLKSELPGIVIDRSSVHRMLLSIRKGKKNVKRHKSYINVTVPPKINNSMRRVNDNFHNSQAQVSYVNQLAQMCEENTVGLSVDNKQN